MFTIFVRTFLSHYFQGHGFIGIVATGCRCEHRLNLGPTSTGARARHNHHQKCSQPRTNRNLNTAIHRRKLAAMSSASPTKNLCNPISVPTHIPNVDMTAEWCATPDLGLMTSVAMQDCCTSGQVQNISGCAFCYTNASSEENKVDFLQDFSQCLVRGMQHQNASRPSASYCNAPDLPVSASTSRVQSWSMWALYAGVAFSFVYRTSF